jgi:hypothetical protein
MELASTNDSVGRKQQRKGFLFVCAFIAIGLITLQVGTAPAAIVYDSVVVSELLVSTGIGRSNTSRAPALAMTAVLEARGEKATPETAQLLLSV